MNSRRTPGLLWLHVLASLLATSILLPVPATNAGQGGGARIPGAREFLSTLSEQERAWLRDHPVIRVVQDPGWPPVEFADERGEPSGMARDYLNLVQQRLDVRFEQVRHLSWQEAYARLKRWEIDMTTSVAVTPERAEFWAFTKPYMTIPIVIATQPDVTYIANMRELAGKRVAVVDGYAVTDWIPRDFPAIRLVRVKTAEEGLEALQRGDVFAYIDNLLIIGHYQAKMKVTNIKIAGETPYVNAQAMAVRKDWAILAGILQKTLDSISDTERGDIYRRWLPIRYEHGFNYTLLWQALAAFTVVLVALVVWNRRLSRQIGYRKQAEAALRGSEQRFRSFVENASDIIYALTLEGIFTYLSPNWLDLMGEPAADAVGRPFEPYVHPDDVHIYREFLDRLLTTGERFTSADYRVVRRDGSSRWHSSTGGAFRDPDGTVGGYMGIARDVTEHKQAEAALAQRTRHLEALRAVSEEITRELDLTRLLRLLIARAAELVGAAAATLYLWEPETGLVVPAAWHGLGDWQGTLRQALGQGIAGTVAQTRQGLVVNDYRTSPYANPVTLQHTQLTASLGEPLLYREELIGAITVSHAGGRCFTEEDQELVRLFATQAAIAIENARLYDAAQHELAERKSTEAALAARTRQLDAIRAVGVEITQELDLKRVLTLIAQQAVALVGADADSLWAWDAASQTLRAEAWHGQGDWMAGRRLRPGEGIAGTVARQRAGMIDNAYPTSAYAQPIVLANSTITASLAEPLLFRDRFLGVLVLDRTAGRPPFQPADQTLLRLFAAHAAIAIENARLYDTALRRGEELQALLDASRSLMADLDLHGMLERIVAAASTISGSTRIKIALYDPAARALRVECDTGSATPVGALIPLEGTLSGLAFRTREPVFSADSAHDPRNAFAAMDAALGLVTSLNLPICGRETVLGTLSFHTTAPRTYTPEELGYLQAFAAQAAIAIENARLFAELNDSYTRLQAAQTELVRSEKLRGLGQMAAGIAHDLNNMLAAILGQVELLKLRGVPLDIQDPLRTLETAAADGAHVVRRLQDFARQRGSLPLVALTLPSVVQEALDLTAPRWKDEVQRRGHTIHVHAALGDLPPILGHAPEIREALTNLIFNAVDAMPAGGVLTVTGTSTPTEVCLHVADTGVGMPETVRQKVFEPFFTTKGVEGMGFGLAAVYGIMQRHGGRVDVTSVPGQGTTFTLGFQPAPAAPSETVPDSPSAPTLSRCILLIDDEPVVRRSMAELLRAAGQTVLAAESGPAGLAHLDHTLPDLVLTDLGMPEMSGVDVARRVKAVHPRLPVVLLTGWGDAAMLSAEDRQVVDRVLGKPVRLADLLRVIAEVTGSTDPVTT